MPRKAQGGEKVGIIRETRPNGDIYVYERITIYDEKLHYSRPKSKTLIGKILKGTTEMIDTRPKKKSAAQLAVTQNGSEPVSLSSRRHVGMLDVVAHVAEKSGIRNEVFKALGDDKGAAQKILTMAWYAFATDGGTWPGLMSWCIRYSGQLPYRDNPISQDMYHDLFVKLGQNEGIKQSVFQHRAQAMGAGELLALDSTTISTESKNLNSGRMSLHKDKLIKNVYKVVEIYSITSRQPVAYAKIPGNIPDGITVENAMKQLETLGLKQPEIVADSGYCSEDNMLYMILKGFRFIMHISSDTKWISPLVLQHQEELHYGGEILHCDPKFSGKTVHLEHTFEYERQRASKKSGLEKGDKEQVTRNLYIHIYFSSLKKAEEDIKFRTRYDLIRTSLLRGAYIDKDDLAFAKKYMKIRRWGDRVMDVQMNSEPYQKQSRYHGFVVLVASREKDTNIAFEKYRAREYVEEDFKNSKYHIGGNHPRVWNDDTLDGQILVQFLAQSMHESFATMLRSLRDSLGVPNGDIEHDTNENLKQENRLKNWINKTSMNGILQWFDAIEQITADGSVKKTWRTETTKRDRMFLDKLEIKPRG